jgi:methyl-accepting chemotaxis protein
MSENKNKKKVYMLEDLEVEEVSIVDRPANNRKFLLVKNEVPMGSKGAHIVTNGNGDLVTDDTVGSDIAGTSDDTPMVLKADDVSFSRFFVTIGENLGKIEKRISINSDLRSKIHKAINDIMGRLYSVMGVMDGAEKSDSNIDSSLLPMLGQELREISKEINKLAKGCERFRKSEDTSSDFAEVIESISSSIDRLDKDTDITDNQMENFTKAIDLIEVVLNDVRSNTTSTGVGSDRSDNSDLLKEVNKNISKLVKAIGDNKERFSGRSNALSVDVGRPDIKKDVHWPLDMNNERTRDTVDKSISFLD